MSRAARTEKFGEQRDFVGWSAIAAFRFNANLRALLRKNLTPLFRVAPSLCLFAGEVTNEFTISCIHANSPGEGRRIQPGLSVKHAPAVEAAADISMVSQDDGYYPMLLFPRLASLLGGSDEALFVAQLHYWIYKSGHIRPEDGQLWIWNSLSNWLKQFSWLPEGTLRRIIKKLERREIVISEKFQSCKWNHTKWYRLNYEKLAEIGWNPCSSGSDQNDQIYSYFWKPTIRSKRSDRSDQNDQITPIKMIGSSLYTEITSRDYDPEITLSPPTPPQEKEREKDEQKYLEQEEGKQGDAIKPKGGSMPQSPASLGDKPEAIVKPANLEKDQFSGGGAASLQNVSGVIQHEWEIAPGQPYPAFVKWRSQHYIDQGGHWAKAPEANAKSEIRNNPQRAADLWQQFLDYSDRAANSALAHKAAGMKPSLPACFQESPPPTKEDVATKLEAIAPTAAPTCNPTPAPTAIAPSAAAPVGSNPTAAPPEDAENPAAYKLHRSDASEASSMPDEIRAKISQMVGSKAMPPMPPRNDEPPAPIFMTPPTLAAVREVWAIPELREQIRKEIADHPHWDLEIVDGVVQEVPF